MAKSSLSRLIAGIVCHRKVAFPLLENWGNWELGGEGLKFCVLGYSVNRI